MRRESTLGALAVVALLLVTPSSILAQVEGRVLTDGTGAAVAVGLVFGLLLYAVNFYALTAVFPWFANARNWVSIFAHGVFGLVLGMFYKRMQKA